MEWLEKAIEELKQLKPPTEHEDASLEDYLQEHVLGFCTCGMPEHSLSLARDVLRHISHLQDLVWEKKQTFKEWEEAGAKICGEREMYFLFYFFHSKDLTEHGGAVPGWLTSWGRTVLQLLDQWENERGSPHLFLRK